MSELFRPMRRKDRQLSQEDTWTLLKQENHGVLAVAGEDNWPYAVPMNYVLWKDCLYLHCAKEAYFLEAIARNHRVCFTVVPQATLVPEHITTLYESVIVFGEAQLVTEEPERAAVLHEYVFHLGQVSQEIGDRYLAKLGPRTALVRITPKQVTGKANRRYIPVTDRLK